MLFEIAAEIKWYLITILLLQSEYYHLSSVKYNKYGAYCTVVMGKILLLRPDPPSSPSFHLSPTLK